MLSIMRRNMRGQEKLISFLLLLLIYSLRTVIAQDIIVPGQSVRDGETIVSANQSFELGFFSPGNSPRRYVGIWYKKIAPVTVVWVANREAPVLDTSAILRMNDKGVLVLLNSADGDVVWSSNVIRTVNNPVARLLDSGNLVVKDGNDSSGNSDESYLWQSFDYPGDTLLPGMKLGKDFVTGFDSSFISSWKSLNDPARGTYTFGIDTSGVPQLFVKNRCEAAVFRLRLLNGLGFSRFLRQEIEFTMDEKANYQFQFRFQNLSGPSRIVIRPSGDLSSFTWMEEEWVISDSYPADLCDKYSLCGAYATCDISIPGVCSCLPGFDPSSLGRYGCSRKEKLSCGRGEGFIKVSSMKIPDTSTALFKESISLQECQQICLKNCSCTAYAGVDVRGGCLLWYGELVDMRSFFEGGQDIYVRLAVSEELARRKSWERKRKIVIICSTALPVLVTALGWILFSRKRKIQNRKKIRYFLEKYSKDQNSQEDLELQIIDLKTIVKATAKFSSQNKLGKGGFGPVYKGSLPNGQEIAVKRLSQNSGQGLEEFINEVILIAKLQHNNLVRLLGCCIQEDERILVYEYMSNKSLDYFIFDRSRSRTLNWRMRVNIIDAIARGLLYLHEDSRLRIIHRDIKASNILLDNDMNPKISDFGMARIFERNQTEANTKRVAGTYGYMAPEYAVDGLFSVKSDVFSFGVLVLEIVSGTKNRGFSSYDHDHNLLGHVWKLHMEERMGEVMQDGVDESCELSEVLRRIHIGLLCVQKRPEDRPNMSTVVVMLGGESQLPKPKQPGFFIERNVPEIGSSSGADRFASPNEMTMSMLDAR